VSRPIAPPVPQRTKKKKSTDIHLVIRSSDCHVWIQEPAADKIRRHHPAKPFPFPFPVALVPRTWFLLQFPRLPLRLARGRPVILSSYESHDTSGTASPPNSSGLPPLVLRRASLLLSTCLRVRRPSPPFQPRPPPAGRTARSVPYRSPAAGARAGSVGLGRRAWGERRCSR
jgi:hypothetical protein